jgi:hypothetical protein
MSKLTNYAENEILDHILGTGSFTMPTLYLALETVAGDDSSAGTEVSGDGYSRQAASFGAASSGSASNDADITFSASGGDWGTIVAWALYDAETSGNRLIHGALTSSKAVTDGDTLTFASGNLTVSAD